VYDPSFGAALTRAFRDDLKNSRLVTLAEVKRRPWTSKLGSKVLYLFRSWL